MSNLLTEAMTENAFRTTQMLSASNIYIIKSPKMLKPARDKSTNIRSECKKCVRRAETIEGHHVASTRQQLRHQYAMLSYRLALVALTAVAVTMRGTEAAGNQASPQEGSLRPSCEGMLWWVPLITKGPFTSLLNNAYCPSWMTRHLITKLPQTTHLTLPLKVPAAVFCGLCTHHISVEANLTVTHSIRGVPQTVAQAGVVTRAGEVKHEVRGHQCLVQFAVTGPITGSRGSLDCSINYGIRHYTETATYTAHDVPIVIKEETIDVPGNTVLLTCPPHSDEPTEDNPLIHVWYYPLATSPRIAAPTTNPMVTFRLASQKELVVSCATYHILRITSVVVKTFRVRRSESYQLQGDAILDVADRNSAWDTEKSYGAYGNSEEGDSQYSTASSAGVNLTMVVVAIVSAVGAVLAVFLVIGVVRCMRRNSNRRMYRS